MPFRAASRLAALASLVFSCVVFSTPVGSQNQPIVEFFSVAVYIESGPSELAAFQVDVESVNGATFLVGVEGGQGAFSEPAHYDPEALQHSGRVVLAALSLDDRLPRGRCRVSTLHYYTTAPGHRPKFRGTVTTAVNREAQRIGATLELVREGDKR